MTLDGNGRCIEMGHTCSNPNGISPLAVPYLGLLAGLQLIDPSVANIALVNASANLHMEGATLALAASVSTLAQAATVLVMGFLGDRYGRRRILAASLLLALAGNLLSMLAPAANVFLLGRALTGIALGSVLTSTFASVRAVSRPHQLNAALGLWNLLIVVAFIIGSLLGGWMATLHWRLAMGLVPLICVISLPLLPVLLPSIPANRRLRPDGLGLLTIASAVVLFLYGINHAATGLRSPAFWLPSVLGLLLYGLHIVWERGCTTPIFPQALPEGLFRRRGGERPRLERGPSRAAAADQQLLATGAGIQHQLRGLGPAAVSALLRPGRDPGRPLDGTGATHSGADGLGQPDSHHRAGAGRDRAGPHPYWHLLPALVLSGIGLAFVAVPQSSLFVQEAPDDCFGSVLAFRTTSGQLGFAFGLAISGTMIRGLGFNDLQTRLQLAGLGAETSPQLDQMVHLFLRNSPIALPASDVEPMLTVLRGAYSQGLAGTMLLMASLTGLLLALSLLLLIIGREQQLLHQEED